MDNKGGCSSGRGAGFANTTKFGLWTEGIQKKSQGGSKSCFAQVEFQLQREHRTEWDGVEVGVRNRDLQITETEKEAGSR